MTEDLRLIHRIKMVGNISSMPRTISKGRSENEGIAPIRIVRGRKYLLIGFYVCRAMGKGCQP